MALLPNTEIYVIILIIGLSYFLLSAILNFEILLGHFSLGLPYAMVGWGAIGLISMNEPSSFLLGFLFIWVSISGIYYYMSSYTSTYEKYYLKPAEVTIPIKPNKIGEVKVARGSGFDFIPAKANNLVKPISKGESVRIIELEGINAIVSTDYKEIELENTFSKFYNQMAKLVRILSIKSKYSGTCIVCYGNVKGRKNTVKCPSCDSVAHFEHLKEWININSNCPNCRAGLKLDKSKIILAN